jgi:hypothetical protein
VLSCSVLGYVLWLKDQPRLATALPASCAGQPGRFVILPRQFRDLAAAHGQVDAVALFSSAADKKARRSGLLISRRPLKQLFSA